MPLRYGVKWHDGKPFTAKDVQCTWDLILEKSSDKLRVNPLKSWYRNLDEVTTNGDYEVTFHLKRPQPAFLMLLASGFAPVYPCHVPAREMRGHPIGTGPFKFVEFKPNEWIKVTRNADYWKKARPYLDGIEFTIIRNPTARRFHADRAAVVMSGRRKAKLADVGQSFGESDRTTRRPDLHIAHKRLRK